MKGRSYFHQHQCADVGEGTGSAGGTMQAPRFHASHRPRYAGAAIGVGEDSLACKE